ncbi:MAG TPA: metal-dependent hydrolase, partial [Porticoccus sp.]|nr:metal-dependent hydrolase [Porticoccus sp.]
ETLCRLRGYDLSVAEGKHTRRLEKARKRFPPIVQLAITVSIEHLTAVLSECMLSEGSVLEQADPTMAALWRWHSVEEMEHKAVAFDVYRAVGGTESMRMKVMRRVFFMSMMQFLSGTAYMLRKDGLLFSPGIWKDGLQDLFGKEGIVTSAKPSFQEFFREGFHPWQQDTQYLLDRWVQDFEVSTVA